MTSGKFVVVDTPFNRVNSRSLIGKRFDVPPSYTAVQSERELLSAKSTDELKSDFKLLEVFKHCQHHREQNARLRTIASEILEERKLARAA